MRRSGSGQPRQRKASGSVGGGTKKARVRVPRTTAPPGGTLPGRPVGRAGSRVSTGILARSADLVHVRQRHNGPASRLVKVFAEGVRRPTGTNARPFRTRAHISDRPVEPGEPSERGYCRVRRTCVRRRKRRARGGTLGAQHDRLRGRSRSRPVSVGEAGRNARPVRNRRALARTLGEHEADSRSCAAPVPTSSHVPPAPRQVPPAPRARAAVSAIGGGSGTRSERVGRSCRSVCRLPRASRSTGIASAHFGESVPEEVIV